MTHALALCWLGIGLWLLADATRANRVAPVPVTPTRARLLRTAGGLLIAAAAAPLARELGIALGLTALLVLAMAALSVAVVLFPVRPRWYAASLPLALLLALVSLPWS